MLPITCEGCRNGVARPAGLPGKPSDPCRHASCNIRRPNNRLPAGPGLEIEIPLGLHRTFPLTVPISVRFLFIKHTPEFLYLLEYNA